MKSNLISFILNSIYIIFFSIYISYLFKKSRESKDYTIINFLHGGKNGPSRGDIVVGLTFGIVVGLSTTIGIWFSLEHVENFVKAGSKINAVVGGLYSNIIAISLGSATAISLSSIINHQHQEEPLYLTAIGTLIGTLLGIAIAVQF